MEKLRLKKIEGGYPVAKGERLFQREKEAPEVDGLPVFVGVTITSDEKEQNTYSEYGSPTGKEPAGRWDVKADTGWESRADRDELFVEDPNGETEAWVYEQIGYAVSLKVLVTVDPQDFDRFGSENAKKEAARILEDAGMTVDAADVRPAFDKTYHVLDRDGRVIAENVPHWSQRAYFSGGSIFDGNLPITEAIRTVLTHRMEFEKSVERNRKGYRRGKLGAGHARKLLVMVEQEDATPEDLEREFNFSPDRARREWNDARRTIEMTKEELNA